MKKGQEYIGDVIRCDFPNRGIVRTVEDGKEYLVTVKRALPGQKVRFRIQKKRQDRLEGRLLEIVEKSPIESKGNVCPHYLECGGCLYQSVEYEKQLEIKDGQIRRLLVPAVGEECFNNIYEGIIKSPSDEGYRNKMELSFGDKMQGGELMLGMHKQGSFYDVLDTTDCLLMDADMRKIAKEVLSFFREKKADYYHKIRHEGYLRHLLLRKGYYTGEILVDLVTSTDMKSVAVSEKEESDMLRQLVERVAALKLEGELKSILHTKNDRPADVVCDQGTQVLFGDDRFEEKLLGLSFEVTPFSFFQTNSRGASLLYEKVREYVLGATGASDKEKIGTLFDLYSGTGTIAQLLAPVASSVVGVEIVEEAVEAARRNAKKNGLSNCSFIAQDVLKVLDEIEKKPDCIILDPPRDGIHPKALPKILSYGVSYIIYISCKPTSLARDLPVCMEAGYMPIKISVLDMFPATGNFETVCLLGRRKPDDTIKVSVKMDDYYQIRDAEEAEKNPS